MALVNCPNEEQTTPASDRSPFSKFTRELSTHCFFSDLYIKVIAYRIVCVGSFLFLKYQNIVQSKTFVSQNKELQIYRNGISAKFFLYVSNGKYF